MITIKDKALADYVIHEDFQGYKITQGQDSKVLQRTSDLNSALRYIADARLKLEGREGMTLREYTALKNKIINEMMEAQKELASEDKVPTGSPLLINEEA